MTQLDGSLVQTLAGWSPEDAPVTSVYLSVDGRRFPRKADYELRLGDLLRRAKAQAEGLSREARRSVEYDAGAIGAHIRDDFERGSTRGLAVFSSHAAGLWADVALPWPVRNRAVVGPTADVLPLEAFLETYQSFCTALVDFEKARLFLAELGRIEEQEDFVDDVPNRHDQGGWAQMRYQRHVDDHRQHHLKHVADALFRLFRRRPFDHLILAGSDDVLAALDRELHDWLRQRVRARIPLAMTATAAHVLERSLALEQELEAEQEREAIRRLTEASNGAGKAVAGLTKTLAVLGEQRVDRLLVDIDFSAPGVRCPACSTLAESGSSCRVCGGEVEPVPDVVESAVAVTLRHGGSVQTVTMNGSLAEIGGIGAFLRF